MAGLALARSERTSGDSDLRYIFSSVQLAISGLRKEGESQSQEWLAKIKRPEYWHDFRDAFSRTNVLSIGTASATQYVCTIGMALEACNNLDVVWAAACGALRGLIVY
jgi:hypothetical protein